MTNILVTGGSGGLGSELVPRLAAAGHTVRVLSRRPRPPSTNTEWAQGDLATGEGLAEAVSGVDAVIHAATSPFRRTRQTDVEGTRRLLDAAGAAGEPHFFYISIVGIDRIPLPYYKAKLAAEKLVEESAIPYTILRATQFHSLIDRFLRPLAREWLRARRRRVLLLHLPLPGGVAAGFRRGYNCAPDHAEGKVTWAEW